MAVICPGVGVTKPIFSVPLFSSFFIIIKTLVTYIISCSYIWQVSPQLCCGDTWHQTYTLGKSKFPVTEKSTNWTYVSPTPGLKVNDLVSSCISFTGLGKISNTLRQRQNGSHFTDISNQFSCMNIVQILLKFVLWSPINNKLTLVQIIAWHRNSDKPLSESMMA